MEFIVTKTVDLHGGEIGLTDDQAAPRMHKLQRKRKGLYEIISPIQLKVGERIILPRLPKGLEQSLEDPHAEEKARAKKAAEIEKAKKAAEKAQAKAEAEAEEAEAKAKAEAEGNDPDKSKGK